MLIPSVSIFDTPRVREFLADMYSDIRTQMNQPLQPFSTVDSFQHSDAFVSLKYHVLSELIPLSPEERSLLGSLRKDLPVFDVDPNAISQASAEDKAAVLISVLGENSEFSHLISPKVQHALSELAPSLDRTSGFLAPVLHLPEEVARQLILDIPPSILPPERGIDLTATQLDKRVVFLIGLLESGSPTIKRYERSVVDAVLTLFPQVGASDKEFVLLEFPKMWPLLNDTSRQKIIDFLSDELKRTSEMVSIIPLQDTLEMLSRLRFQMIDEFGNPIQESEFASVVVPQKISGPINLDKLDSWQTFVVESLLNRIRGRSLNLTTQERYALERILAAFPLNRNAGVYRSLNISEQVQLLFSVLQDTGEDFDVLKTIGVEEIMGIFMTADSLIQTEILVQLEDALPTLPAAALEVLLETPIVEILVEGLEGGEPELTAATLSLVTTLETTFSAQVFPPAPSHTETPARFTDTELEHPYRFIAAHPRLSSRMLEADEITFLDHIFRVQKIRDEAHHESLHRKILLMSPSAYMAHHSFLAQNVQVLKLHSIYSQQGMESLFQMLLGLGFFDIVLIADSSHAWPHQYEVAHQAAELVDPRRVTVLDSRSFGLGSRLFGMQVMHKLAGESTLQLRFEEAGMALPHLWMVAEKTENLNLTGDDERVVIWRQENLAGDLESIYRRITVQNPPRIIRVVSSYEAPEINEFVTRLRGYFEDAKVSFTYDPYYLIHDCGKSVSVAMI